MCVSPIWIISAAMGTLCSLNSPPPLNSQPSRTISVGYLSQENLHITQELVKKKSWTVMEKVTESYGKGYRKSSKSVRVPVKALEGIVLGVSILSSNNMEKLIDGHRHLSTDGGAQAPPNLSPWLPIERTGDLDGRSLCSAVGLVWADDDDDSSKAAASASRSHASLPNLTKGKQKNKDQDRKYRKRWRLGDSVKHESRESVNERKNDMNLEKLSQKFDDLTLMQLLALNALELSVPATDIVLKNRKTNWVQLSGHEGGFCPAGPGTIWKKRSEDDTEVRAYEMIGKDIMADIVPTFYKDLTYNNEHFMEMQDMLDNFKNPSIMDIKMGSRTFVEAEVSNKKLRPDLFQKMIALDPNYATEEENEQKAITKLRYMLFRESFSSTSTLGFRIEGYKTKDSAAAKDIKLVKTKDQVMKSISLFLGGNEDRCREFVNNLIKIRSILQESPFFASHEIIGSSLLLIYDDFKTKVCMIDFAKSYELPVNVSITHLKPWSIGNHEDGYLFGLNNLIDLLEWCNLGDKDDSELSLHHEFNPSSTKIGHVCAKTLLDYIKSINNPFDAGIRLQNISTGADIPQEVVDGLLECLEIGEKSYEEFVKTRFQNKEKHLHDTIPTNRKTVFVKRISTPSTAKKSMAKKDAAETIRYINYARERGYSMLELLKYELTSTSQFLTTECKDGIKLKKPDKASLARELVSHLPQETRNVKSDAQMTIVDFMALVRKLPMKKMGLHTFEELAKSLSDRILATGSVSTRIDIIFDVYQKSSIKQMERAQRSSSEEITMTIRSDNQKLPVNLDMFWSSMLNKVWLQEYVFKWMLQNVKSDKEIFFG
ncbi:Inositol-trisphosphate 3-kinase [Nymphon striatum]|nr:Inositol-trisphosphate 3-kinase [Nymphon striatum]